MHLRAAPRRPLAGRLVSETSSLNGSTVSYSYTDDHLPETLSLDGSLIARYVHEAGYLRSIDGVAGHFPFDYDDTWRRKSLGYPNGLVTSYDYDPTLGWLGAIRTGPAGGAPLFVRQHSRRRGQPSHPLRAGQD